MALGPLRFVLNMFSRRKRGRTFIVCLTFILFCVFAYNWNLAKELYQPGGKWLREEEVPNTQPDVLAEILHWKKKIHDTTIGGFKPVVTSSIALPPPVHLRSVDCTGLPQSQYLFCEAEAGPMDRAVDLVSRLTTAELISQTYSVAAPIPRLGIKSYNWRSNCLHGWSQSKGVWPEGLNWTVFPAPIGLAATFNLNLLNKIGRITGTEGRAIHNEMLALHNGSSLEAAGVNCFSPNVNLLRDPRWGRGQETFGEDPFLVSAMGLSYTRGLQEGPDKNYLLVGACAKHFAVHSGPESLRLSTVNRVTLYDLYDTYLPAFKSQVVKGKVAQVMPAYSGFMCEKHLVGAPDVANPFLLKSVLREEFGAHNISVISDFDGLEFSVSRQNFFNSYIVAAAASMNASTDIDLGHDYVYPYYLQTALAFNLTTIDTIKEAVTRSFYLRMRLGDFDPPSRVAYQLLNKRDIDTPYHREINLQVARESIVLLKNSMNSHLPLDKEKMKRLVVLGPNANESVSLLSSYEGIPSQTVSVLQGIQEHLKGTDVTVSYAKGCADILCEDKSGFWDVDRLVEKNGEDYVVMVMGMSDGVTEGEALDRVQTSCNNVSMPLLGLPGCQRELVKTVTLSSRKVILVLINGGPLSIPNLYRNAGVVAILEAFYPGAVGGMAVADVLFGAYNPSGKMPVSVCQLVSDLPDFADYRMTTLSTRGSSIGRTYRYSKIKPLFPFGFGLSYSTFKYLSMTVSEGIIAPCATVSVTIMVLNSSPRPGIEVVMAFISAPGVYNTVRPNKRLVGFKKVHIKPDVRETVTIEIEPYAMSMVDHEGVHYLYPGEYHVTSVSDEDLNSIFELKAEGDNPVRTSTCKNSPQCLACGGE